MDHELAYLISRYDQETSAADSAGAEARIRHLELALRYSLAAARLSASASVECDREFVPLDPASRPTVVRIT